MAFSSSDILSTLNNGVIAINTLTQQIQSIAVGRLPVSTFAALPSAAVSQGVMRMITDSNTATWGATAAAGGANIVMVVSNGTNWIVH